ncbi:unnamed protein product [Hapterophycus canaliculatus]
MLSIGYRAAVWLTAGIDSGVHAVVAAQPSVKGFENGLPHNRITWVIRDSDRCNAIRVWITSMSIIHVISILIRKSEVEKHERRMDLIHVTNQPACGITPASGTAAQRYPTTDIW